MYLIAILPFLLHETLLVNNKILPMSMAKDFTEEQDSQRNLPN